MLVWRMDGWEELRSGVEGEGEFVPSHIVPDMMGRTQ